MFLYTCSRPTCEDWSTTDREEAVEHGALGPTPRHLIAAKSVNQ